MALTLKKDYQGLRDLKRRLSQLEQSSVEVGIFEESVYTGNESGRGEREVGHNAGVSVATIAAINEYGTYDVPSRPFRDATIQSIIRNQTALGADIEKAITKNVPKATQQMGKRFKDLMHMIVDSWSMRDSNSSTTVKEKGFNKPLEWTGKMLASIDYRVRGK